MKSAIAVTHKALTLSTLRKHRGGTPYIQKYSDGAIVSWRRQGDAAAMVLPDVWIAANNTVRRLFPTRQRATAVAGSSYRRKWQTLWLVLKARVEKLNAATLKRCSGSAYRQTSQQRFCPGAGDDALEQGGGTPDRKFKTKKPFYPTLWDHQTKDMEIAWEEPWPCLPIIRIKSGEAIEIANALRIRPSVLCFTTHYQLVF